MFLKLVDGLITGLIPTHDCQSVAEQRVGGELTLQLPEGSLDNRLTTLFKVRVALGCTAFLV